MAVFCCCSFEYWQLFDVLELINIDGIFIGVTDLSINDDICIDVSSRRRRDNDRRDDEDEQTTGQSADTWDVQSEPEFIASMLSGVV